MRNIFKNKRFVLVAGIAVGLITLFSHSLRVEIGGGKDQATEQTSEGDHQAIIVAPSDAVTVSFFSLQTDAFQEIAPVFYPAKKILKVVQPFQRATLPHFRTLFRFIISPNAP